MTVSRVPFAITFGKTRIDALCSVVTCALCTAHRQTDQSRSHEPDSSSLLTHCLLLFGHGPIRRATMPYRVPLRWPYSANSR